MLLILSLMLPLISLDKPGLGSPHEARIVVAGQNMALDVYLLSRSDISGPRREFASLAPEPPGWLNVKNVWLAFGFLAQGLFFGRFLLQWIASERKKESVIPVGFWWLSLVGGMMLFSYAIHRRDPVFIVGQAMGILIYLRNLYFIYLKRPKKQLP